MRCSSEPESPLKVRSRITARTWSQPERYSKSILSSRASSLRTCGTRSHFERRAADHARSEFHRVERKTHASRNRLLKHAGSAAGRALTAAEAVSWRYASGARSPTVVSITLLIQPSSRDTRRADLPRSRCHSRVIAVSRAGNIGSYPRCGSNLPLAFVLRVPAAGTLDARTPSRLFWLGRRGGSFEACNHHDDRNHGGVARSGGCPGAATA